MNFKKTMAGISFVAAFMAATIMMRKTPLSPMFGLFSIVLILIGVVYSISPEMKKWIGEKIQEHM